eukprot:699287-Amphidinium_carterae.1
MNLTLTSLGLDSFLDTKPRPGHIDCIPGQALPFIMSLLLFHKDLYNPRCHTSTLLESIAAHKTTLLHASPPPCLHVGASFTTARLCKRLKLDY